ncbi:ABC-type nitrate/sulfonate/bicarbonate transport system substrate-binding protein [Kribbella steppae]|uniref:ABC-type nitrate/sulfonate/bicarbonate transport system substrate-binding protein n=1 Tax=Kribbella steppae TaxID=2512223 RepID=A0A4R2H2X2_9ACTN|nr:ABC transporter substrate-binding protein [Kribbella steppae]TCO19611.1 ABC-type nitrate/sulfonate/bicarbonate transport system substrate-binding protein [Kribbella steppae]
MVRSRWACVAGTLVAVAVAASACSQPVAPTAQSSAVKQVKVKGLFASASNNVPMMVAAENGYWRERGLDVTVQVLDTGSAIATALVTGAADIGAGNATSSVPLSRAAGNDFVLVGPYHNNPLVVAGTERVAIIAGKDSGVRAGDPRSLIGKSVAVTEGNTNENYLRAYLQAHGMSMSDIKPVNMAYQDMPTALSQGNVDVVVPMEPGVSETIRKMGDATIVLQRGGPYGSSVVGVMVTDKYLAEHPDVVKQYVLGVWEGVKFTREHPEEAAALAQRYISGVNVEDVTSGLKQMRTEFDPRISPCTEKAVMGEQARLIADHSMKLAKPLPYDKIVATDFIKGLLADDEGLAEGLAPLPANVSECK